MPSTTLPVLNGGIVELNTTELTKSINELAGQVKELVNNDNIKSSAQNVKQTQSLNFSSNRGVSTSQRNAINNASNPTNRAQSLLNLSASGIMRATAGDLRDRAIDRFQNNSLVRFGMNAANAYRGFTGRSPVGSRRELTQSQLEDKRENTERQETTNDLLKKILEALSGKGSGVLDPKKEGGIISSILGTIGSALLIPKLLKALGLAAIAGLGAYLADNAPELRSVIKSIRSFIDIFKTLEMPKGFAGLKTSFNNIGTWITNTTDKLSKLKLTNITDAFTTNFTKLTDFLKSIKTNIFEKFPKIDKIVTPSFTDKLRAVTTFFKNISNFIKIDDMPSPKIMSGIGTLIKDFGIRFNSVFDSVKTVVSNLKNLIPNLPKSLLPSSAPISSVMGQVKPGAIPPNGGPKLPPVLSKIVNSKIVKSAGGFAGNMLNRGLGFLAGVDVYRSYTEDDKVTDNLMLGPNEKPTEGQRIRSSLQEAFVNFGFRGVLSLMGLTDINANKLLTAKMAYGDKYGNWFGDLMLLRDIRLGNIDFSNKKTDTSKPTEDNVLSLAERIIKEEEDFEPDPYPDGNGYSVGYGFNFGKENVLPKDSAKGLISTNERTEGMKFDKKYFYRGDEGKSRALTKLREIIKERYDRLSANSVFANLAGEGSAVRKAVMLSLAYQVGTDGVLNKKDGYVKMLEAISKGDFDAAGYEILDSDTYKQSKERQTRASEMMKSGILSEKDYPPESASIGNIARSRQRLIVGDYTGVKQNPELTLALSDLRDNAVATVQKMNDKNKKDAIRDIEIQKIAYEKSVELAVKKSLDSEMRIRTAEGRSNGGINGATIPLVTNVVDNTQVSSINQSVFLKDGPINRGNYFLTLN